MTPIRPAWPLALPVILASLVLVLLPLLATLGLSFWQYDGLSAPQWVGLDHYRRLSEDPMFRLAQSNSLQLAAVLVPLRMGLALGLALLLQYRGRSGGIARSAALAPVLVPDIAWALLWLWLLNPLFGPAGALLEALGWPAAATLMSAEGARASIVLCLSFLIGETLLILIAARREIPSSLYEAAKLEGASSWTLTRRITLPLMAPALLLLSCRDVALAFQLTLVPSLIITKGGPLFSTTVLPLYVYQNAFEYLRFGYAAALSASMLAVTLTAVFVQLWMLRRLFRR